MNDGELETSEEKFWGKMEEYRQKNKKKGTQVANLTTCTLNLKNYFLLLIIFCI